MDQRFEGIRQSNPPAEPSQNTVASIGATSLAYDNAADETSSGSSSFTWDWRNRLNTSLIAATSSTYSYDENDKPVRVNDGLTVFYYPNDLYQADSLSGVPTKHIQLNGRDIAVLTGTTGSSSIKYSFPDNQNSTNVVTDSTSNISQILDYFPYGSRLTTEFSREEIAQLFWAVHHGDTVPTFKLLLEEEDRQEEEEEQRRAKERLRREDAEREKRNLLQQVREKLASPKQPSQPTGNGDS